MAAQINTPSLLLLKEGIFTEQMPTRAALNPPKTIHYKHTIRMLPGQCSHQDEIARLKMMYSNELLEKDQQIEKLKKMLTEKGQKNSEEFCQEIQSQLKFLMPPDNRMDLSRIETGAISQISIGMGESILTNVTTRKNSQVENIFYHYEKEPNDSEQVLKVKKEMRSTMEVLSNITEMLNKPRRKYEFYNTSLQKQLEQNSSRFAYKKLEETSLQLYQNNNKCNQSFIQHLEPSKEDDSQYLDQYDDSDLDPTDEEESPEEKDTLSFIEGAVKEHEMLKQALIDLEESTRKEFEEMKSYYQSEIQQYVEILSQSSAKQLGANNLNSTRSNIQRQKDNDNDSEEQINKLRRQQKFEIIFPEEEYLDSVD